MGDNIFIVEFGSKHDLDRILDGSPWRVGNKAVLIQKFDPSLRPTDVKFDKLAVWIRIHNLPFGLMNKKWGMELAGKVGTEVKVEVDAQDRAWGPFLRARVSIDLSKPLLRCVSIFSVKRQTQEWYDVRYEKIPSYCYSCGIIGHSSLECPTPAERDEAGLLPYGRDLRAPDDNKKKGVEEKQPSMAGRSFNTNEHQGSFYGRSAPRGSNSRGKEAGSSTGGETHSGVRDDEDIPPLKQQKLVRKTGADKVGKSGKELFPTRTKGDGKKRKQNKNPHPSSESMDESMKDASPQDALALIVAVQHPTKELEAESGVDLEEHGDGNAKKMKKEKLADLALSAGAGDQPCREP